MSVPAVTAVEKLPVPVLDHPHWRVNYRPSVYRPNRLPTLSDCLDVLQKTKVRLRGWDFPHVPSRESERAYGDSWIAGWTNFGGHIEYWRFYQSTQFLYLGSLREVADEEWSSRLRQTMRWHADDDVDIDAVPGFLDFTNAVYHMTEFFEFAARLVQAQIYAGPVTLTISLVGIAGFMLAADANKGWSSDYVARTDDPKFETTLPSADLVSSAAEQAIKCSVRLFEVFNWSKPNLDAIRADQQKLLTRQL